MKRAYQIRSNQLVPVAYNDKRLSVYVPSQLLTRLYKASDAELQEACNAFQQAVGSDDFQILCLTGDENNMQIDDCTAELPAVEVPVDKIYKIDR